MIFDVLATPEAISEPTRLKDDALRVRKRLLDVLRKHGVLVFASDEDAARFRDAVERLGPKERTSWLELLKRLHPENVGEPPRPLKPDDETSLSEWNKKTQLVVVSPFWAVRYGMPSDTACWRAEGLSFEVVHTDAIDLATVVDDGREASVRMNPPQGKNAPATRQEIWERWLEPLARRHPRATLVDRYIGKNIVNAANRADGLGFGAKHPTEAPWLLGRLASLDTQLHLEIVTGRCDPRAPTSRRLQTSRGKHMIAEFRGKEVTADLIESALKDAWEALKARREDWGMSLRTPPTIELFTFADKDVQHARHLRFSTKPERLSRYVGFDGGFDRLAHEDLRFAGGYWILSYFTGLLHQEPPVPGEVNDEQPLKVRSERRTVVLE